MTSNQPTSIQTAEILMDAGYMVVPIAKGKKHPNINKWEELRLEKSDISRYWAEGDKGVGIVCGVLSEDGTGVVAVDIDRDDDEILRDVRAAIRVHGSIDQLPAKRGAKGITYFVRSLMPIPSGTIKFKRRNIGDLLSIGKQTVIPPSVHPDTKKPYKWIDCSLLNVPFHELIEVSEWTIDELYAIADPDNAFRKLNEMNWAGEGGGGDTHDTSVSAVAAMVARDWPDQAIHDRIEEAKRYACERSGESYNWPASTKIIQEWISSAREKGFTGKAKRKRKKEIAPTDITDKYVYIGELDRLYDLEDAILMNSSQINNIFKNQFESAWSAIMRSDTIKKVISYTYDPGHPGQLIVTEPKIDVGTSVEALNAYRSPDIQPKKGDCSLFMDHLHLLMDKQNSAVDHVMSWLSFHCQNPGQKIKHSLLIQGGQGIGKSLIFDAMALVLGTHNVSSITHDDILADFNSWVMGTQMVIVEEVLGEKRKNFMNKVKPMITQPTIRVNEKFLPAFRLTNRVNFAFLTNYEHAMGLDEDDRRFFVHFSKMEVQDREYYAKIYDWLENKGGASNLLHLFQSMDLSNFYPSASPPNTESKADAIDQARSELSAYLKEAYEAKAWPLKEDIIVPDHVASALKPIIRCTPIMVRTQLSRLGGIKLKRAALDDGFRFMWAIRRIKQMKKLSPKVLANLYSPVHPPMMGESIGWYSAAKSGPVFDTDKERKF